MTQDVEANPGETRDPAEAARSGLSDAARGAIRSFLRKVRRRLLADRFLNLLCADLLVGLSLVALVILLDRLVFPGMYRWDLVGLILGLAVIVSVLRTFARRPSLFQTAVEADHRLGLKERVSSACYTHDFEHAGRPPGGPETKSFGPEWAALVLEDAGRSLDGISVQSSFPVGSGRRARWLAVPLLVSVAFSLWLPTYDPLGLMASEEEPEDALVKKAMEAEKNKLDKELEELLKKAEKEQSEEARKLLKLLAEQAARKETPSPPTKPEKAGGKKPGETNPQKAALLELARREDVLKRGIQNEKFQALQKAMKELKGLQLSSAGLTRALQAALKDGDFAKAKRELDALRKKLAALSQKKPSELTEKEKELLEKLKEELASLSRSAGALGQLAPNLAALGGSIGAGDLQQMMEGMDDFGMDLDSLAGLSNDLDFLNQALEMIKMSKQDLAQLAKHKCPNCGKKLGDGKGGT